MAQRAERRTPGAQSVRRAVKVLRILAAGQEHGVRLTDVVAESGLNRPTAHRLLKVLSEEGAVEQDPATRRYMIGQEVSLLGLARVARFPVKALAEPYLRHISEQVGDTVFLTIRSGLDSICVDRRIGAYPVQVFSIEVGARRPLGAAAAGLMLLACLPEEEAAELVQANAPRLAQQRITPARLLERVRQARARGYAFNEVGVVRGTRALSVPVFDGARNAVAAISIAAIADRMAPARLATLVALLKSQAEALSRRIVAVERANRRREVSR